MSEFKMRPLAAKDIAPMTRIISKIGISEVKKLISPELIAAASKKNKKDNSSLESVGVNLVFDVAGIVCANYGKAEADINEFLASLYGMEPNEVSELSLAVFAELVVGLFKSDGFSDFFTRVKALL